MMFNQWSERMQGAEFWNLVVTRESEEIARTFDLESQGKAVLNKIAKLAFQNEDCDEIEVYQNKLVFTHRRNKDRRRHKVSVRRIMIELRRF